MPGRRRSGSRGRGRDRSRGSVTPARVPAQREVIRTTRTVDDGDGIEVEHIRGDCPRRVLIADHVLAGHRHPVRYACCFHCGTSGIRTLDDEAAA